MTTTTERKLTPPELARMFGVGVGKILTWIRSGELPAMNAATRLDGRPRYRIDMADVRAYELRRSVGPVAKAMRRRRASGDVHEFF